LVALAKGRGPVESLAIASPFVPARWSVRAHAAAGGTAVVAGPAARVQGEHAVIGAAVGDPWGLPGRPLDPVELLRRFVRYGDQVIQLAAGPFAVVDLARGSVASAMNGIVPVFVGRGTHSAVGTHQGIVAALAGGGHPRPVQPGAVAFNDGTTTTLVDWRVHESLSQIRLETIDEEVEVHISRAGRPRPLGSLALARVAAGLRVRRMGDSLVAAPALAGLRQLEDPEAALVDLRARVGRLWWEAGLRATPLFVPVLERPALDTMSLVIGAK
jgi:hypothetical protein